MEEEGEAGAAVAGVVDTGEGMIITTVTTTVMAALTMGTMRVTATTKGILPLLLLLPRVTSHRDIIAPAATTVTVRRADTVDEMMGALALNIRVVVVPATADAPA